MLGLHYLVDQSPGRALYNDRGEINDNTYGLNTHPNIVGKHNLEYDFATAPTLNLSEAIFINKAAAATWTRSFSTTN